MFQLPNVNAIILKAALTAAVLAAVGGYILYQKYELAKANEAVALITAERDNAIGDLEKAVMVAKTNAETIAILGKEKKDIEASISNLKSRSSRDQKFIDYLTTVIEGKITEESSKQPLSPVVKAVIDAVQIERDARQESNFTKAAK